MISFLQDYFAAIDITQTPNNFHRRLRFFNLYSTLKNCIDQNLPGYIAECGCWKGCSTVMMKLLLERCDSDKSILVFDSFEGLSDFDDIDLRPQTQVITPAQSKERHASSLKHLQDVLSVNNFLGVELFKGWIPNVFSSSDPSRAFCLVHIDVDLYQPTLDSFNYFFPRLVKGGAIVCDDYNSTAFPGCAKAVQEFINTHPSRGDFHFIEFSAGGCILIRN